jgi:3-methyladenine DNA glycosylase/8-oxoguanine DNA glycosylase
MNQETIDALSRIDKVLGRLIQKVGRCTLKAKPRSPFEALVKSVTPALAATSPKLWARLAIFARASVCLLDGNAVRL